MSLTSIQKGGLETKSELLVFVLEQAGRKGGKPKLRVSDASCRAGCCVRSACRCRGTPEQEGEREEGTRRVLFHSALLQTRTSISRFNFWGLYRNCWRIISGMGDIESKTYVYACST